MQKVFGKYIGSVLLIFTALVLLSTLMAGSAEAADPFMPISVDGNAELDDLFGSNPAWAGLGTEADPYIIENLDINAATYDAAIWIRNTDRYLVIKDCVLHDPTNYAIRFYNVQNVVLENNSCNQTTFGIYLGACSNIVVNGNDCRENDVGVYLDGSNEVAIRYNNCSGGQTGVYLTESSDNILNNNTCNDTFDGILVQSESDWNVINGNICIRSQNSGITIDFSANNTVSNNTLYACGTGIALIDAVNNTLFRDNCSNGLSGSAAITLDYSHYNALIENNCSYNYGGILLTLSDNNTVHANTCLDNEGNGIEVDSSNNNTVSDNHCNGYAYAGIIIKSGYFDSRFNTVLNNQCSYPGALWECYGIQLWSGSYLVSYNTMVGNDCSDNYYGIYILNSPNNTIAFNTVHDNAGSGIRLEGSSYTIVSSNTVYQNGDSGIWLDNSERCVIRNNTGELNTDGIYLSDSDLNELSGNDLDGNTFGLFLYNSSGNSITENNCTDNEFGIYVTGISQLNDIDHNTCIDNVYTGILLDGSANNSISYNTCSGNVGIVIESSANSTVSNNTCTGNYDGISVSNSPGSSMLNNTCTGNYDGIVVFQSSDSTIAGNVCDGNTYGILLSSDSDDNTLILNSCNNNAMHGITVGYSERNLLSYNTCNQNIGHGIVIGTSASNTLFNNYCQDNGNCGILLENAQYNILDKNTCIADNPANGPSSTVGIKLYGSDHNEVFRNICEHNGVGLIMDGSNFNSISFNELNYNNYFMGLRRSINVVSSSNNNITNNSCMGSDYGISISGGDDIRMEGNDFSNNADKGIEINNIWYDKARYVIANNTCIGNVYGIWVQGPLYDSRVINNTCEDNSMAGMYFEYRSYNNVIADNTLVNNHNGMILTGVGDDDCYGNTIANNTIESSMAYGISITSSTRNHIFGNVLIGNNGATSEYDPAHVQAYDSGENFWNDTEYGNLWADWTSPDSNGDGIVDEAYLIDGGASKDLLPLAVSVAITSPADGFATGETSVDISGTALSYFGVDHLTWHNAANDASGDCYGTDAWTAAVPLADGDNVITVTMVDLHGSEANASITVVLDVVPPTLEITYPAEGAYLGSSVTVTWNGSDAESGIDYYAVSIEGMFFVNVTGSSYTINDLADGTYTVLVSAYDAVGNYLDMAVSFTVDVTSPTVTIDSPADNFLSTDNSVTVIWNGSDIGSGVDRYEVSWEGGSPVTLLPSVNTYTFNGLSDGSHVLTVTIYDKAGRSSSDSVTVKVDIQAPSLSITYPAEGGYVANSEVTVTWAGFDAGTGITYYTVSMEGSFSINTTGSSYTINDLEDGTYTVMVSAYDALGNCRDEVVTFIVDTIAPTLEIDTPEEGQLFNVTSVTVTWTTSDVNPGTIQIRFDGEPWVLVYEEQFVKLALTAGPHAVYVKVTDAAGNFAISSGNFTLDLDDPVVVIVSPAEGALLNDTVGTVEWTAEDPTSSLNGTFVRVDGGNWTELGSATAWIYSLEDGAHTIEVKVTDAAGNSATATVNFTVDTTAPTAEVSPTGDQASLSPLIVVEFSELMNQTSVEITVDGVEGSVDWSGNTATLTLSQRLAYGTAHNVTVTGTDLAGNSMTTSWTFSTLSVGSVQGKLVNGDGDPLEGIEVRLSNGDNVTTDSQGSFLFEQVGEGNYTLTVDADGYEVLSMSVESAAEGITDLGELTLVSADDGGENGGTPWVMVIAVLAIIAVVAVAAVVYFKKK